jgi:hypothetical protein
LKLKNLLFEFEDLSWFPGIIRSGMTDYLRCLFKVLDMYKPVVPLIIDGLERTGTDTIIDLCSGGGGAIEKIEKAIAKRSGKEIKIVLTDKFPNLDAFKFLSAGSRGEISFSTSSVDAANVPNDRKGFRTVFSAFHHFGDAQAKTILQNAVNSNCGIGIFDGGDKNIFIIFSMIILHPLAFFFLTPFIRPFKISRILFTYFIPVIPLCTIWDGIVSITRLRSTEQLLEIANQACSVNYTWKAGKIKNKAGLNIAYLTGCPAKLA